MKTKFLFFLIITLLIHVSKGYGQETVFTFLKSDEKLAQKYFNEGNYFRAVNLYENLIYKNPDTKVIKLKIAQCYYHLKQYDRSVLHYEKYFEDAETLPAKDAFYCSEAYSALGNYDKAIDFYKLYLQYTPNDPLVVKKIWQLNNIQYLFEDSLHYAVSRLAFNTGYGELCAVPYRNGLVFLSNRKEIQIVAHSDASLNTPFYRLYFITMQNDSSLNTTTASSHFNQPESFSKILRSKFHAGPVSFYSNERKMVFTSTENGAGKDGKHTLQLQFAEFDNSMWKLISSFPYNSNNYSISDPSISSDGKLLIFSSNMNGGYGGKDLYKSEFINGAWSRPVNLGEAINTTHDEVYPYLHPTGILYFSSNGHPGMGGLDLFKTELKDGDFQEPQNLGFPLNTHFDDFGITMDSLQTHGYFTSNRTHGGYNDDIYEFDMDIQIYPLMISGSAKYKEFSWSDSIALKPLTYTKVSLIDNIRNVAVQEVLTDSLGNFSITIPYFSKYKMKVTLDTNDEHIVSFEIPKHRKTEGRHEIVIVKDAFRSEENEVAK